MPRNGRPPSYRRHKARNSAVVTIDGRNHYLGAYGSPESHEKYARLIAEWRLHSRKSPPTTGPGQPDPTLSVNELILAYFRHVQAYYVKDGRPTSEQDNIRQALRFLRKTFGTTPASEFGPLALKVVRQSMIEARRSRRLINQDVHRIRAMFRWAAGEELYPGESLAALGAVTALEKGRSDAKELPPSGRSRRPPSWRRCSTSPARWPRWSGSNSSPPRVRARFARSGPGMWSARSRVGFTVPSRTRPSTTAASG